MTVSGYASRTMLALVLLILFGLAVLAALSALLLFLLIRDTARRRGRWGVNVEAVTCPRCVTELKRLRWPASLQQALWGGYTCSGCGLEIDKWGREREPRSRA